MAERQVQYEFKVIVRVPEDAWPHEVRDSIWDMFEDFWLAEVVSVEQIRDNY